LQLAGLITHASGRERGIGTWANVGATTINNNTVVSISLICFLRSFSSNGTIPHRVR
jgi:hypothetical protein